MIAPTGFRYDTSTRLTFRSEPWRACGQPTNLKFSWTPAASPGASWSALGRSPPLLLGCDMPPGGAGQLGVVQEWRLTATRAVPSCRITEPCGKTARTSVSVTGWDVSFVSTIPILNGANGMNRSSSKRSPPQDGRPPDSAEGPFANALPSGCLATKCDVEWSASKPPSAPPASATKSAATRNRLCRIRRFASAISG